MKSRLEIVRAEADRHFLDYHELRRGWHPLDYPPGHTKARVRGSIIHVAYFDGEPSGFSDINHHRGGWDHLAESPPVDSAEVVTWMNWIFVVPHLRGNGLGAALLDTVIANARASRSVMVALMPDESDDESDPRGLDRRTRFFTEQGFIWATPAGNTAGWEPWLLFRRT